MKKVKFIFILVLMILSFFSNSIDAATNKKEKSVQTDSQNFSLKIVKENNLYGVKSSVPVFDKNLYVLVPQNYKSIVLCGSNPGNTYIIAQEEKGYVLFDKYGFCLANAEEINPVFLADCFEVRYFILKYKDSYALYKCPEKYELIKYSDSKSKKYGLKPILTIIEENSKLIQLMNNGSEIRCVRYDDSVETIRVI